MRCPHKHPIPAGKRYCPTCNRLAVARYRAKQRATPVVQYMHGPTWNLLIALGYVGRKQPKRIERNSLGLTYRGP